ARLRVAPDGDPRIPLPSALFGASRVNSRGLDLAHAPELHALGAAVATAWRDLPTAAPSGGAEGRTSVALGNPADPARIIGYAVEATAADIDAALSATARAAPAWDAYGGEARAEILRRAAALLEAHRARLLALIIAEGGRT
ncbi:aldehyde dehydrogenase family protein, partial [Leclercia adecarboxylata]|uniref:aldehyde dehydrogenase family protein n=1 Tax=Leclercia adecarboxylata TaxID=83655 RepID=UPI00234E0587